MCTTTWTDRTNRLASGSFLLLFARIADLFGRRSMFIWSLFLYSIITLGAGFSRTPITLDVLAGFMGLMSAAAVPPAQGMLGVIYEKPSKRKNAAFACFSAGNPLGFVFGIVCSGIASHLFDWRASFWFLAIIYIIFAAIACFIVPSDTSEKEQLSTEGLKKFDIIGTFLTIAGTGMFSAALRYVTIGLLLYSVNTPPDTSQSWKRCSKWLAYWLRPRTSHHWNLLHHFLCALGTIR